MRCTGPIYLILRFWMGSFEEGAIEKKQTNSVESDLFDLMGCMNVRLCLLFLRG